MAKRNRKLTFHIEGEANQRMSAEQAAYEKLQSQIVALDNQHLAGALSDKEHGARLNILFAKHIGRKAVRQIE